MSKYLKVVERESSDKPKNPEFCDVVDCTSYYPGNGKPGLRGKADVVITTPSGVRIARCCYHYDRELYRARLGRNSPMMAGAVDLTVDMVREHWEKIDSDEVAKESKRRRDPELHHAPVKPYTEVDHDSAA